MALGDNNYKGNGNSNKVFDSTFYSRMRIKNKDKLAVDFNYSKGLLKIILSEEKENFKYDPIVEINLSPTKAKLLKAKLKVFIDRMKNGDFIDPKEADGVNSGMGETVSFIAFKVTGNRTDVPEHSFIIGKVNKEGVIESATEFVFNVDYDYSLHWNDIEKMNVEKTVDQFMGINTFVDVLEEFTMSSAGAIGASVWDTGRYEVRRIMNKIDPIWDKLGIERKQNNGGSDNFFSRQDSSSAMNPPRQSRSTPRSYDDIENLVSDEE